MSHSSRRCPGPHHWLVLLLLTLVPFLSGCGDKVMPAKVVDPSAYSIPVGDDKMKVIFYEVRLFRKDDVIELFLAMNVINGTDQPLRVRAAGMQLLDATGEKIPEVYNIKEEDPVVPPHSEAFSYLRFRPKLEALNATILLSVGDKKKVVKDRSAFDERDLPTYLGGASSFIAPNWADPNSRQMINEEEEMNARLFNSKPEETIPADPTTPPPLPAPTPTAAP